MHSSNLLIALPFMAIALLLNPFVHSLDTAHRSCDVYSSKRQKRKERVEQGIADWKQGAQWTNLDGCSHLPPGAAGGEAGWHRVAAGFSQACRTLAPWGAVHSRFLA